MIYLTALEDKIKQTLLYLLKKSKTDRIMLITKMEFSTFYYIVNILDVIYSFMLFMLFNQSCVCATCVKLNTLNIIHEKNWELQ